MKSINSLGILVCVLLNFTILHLQGEEEIEKRAERPLLLLYDDYYQSIRPDRFSQGISLIPEDRKLTNFYHPYANSIPNGTFVFSRIIAEDFTIKVSQLPLTSELLGGANAYMMVCPIKKEMGGRKSITEFEADLLESFVAEGGILILVLNSFTDPHESHFDLEGMNLISSRFGFRFMAKQTDTLLIPIGRDHPVFSDVENVIYGAGTTIEHETQPDTEATVLLESNNPNVPGTVALRLRYKKGTVLALGDAGTLGNAHGLRNETDQWRVLKQLFHNLLPEGPMPGYGWRNGLKLRVKLWHQQAISGYPEELRLFDPPRDPAAEIVVNSLRKLDSEAADSSSQEAGETNAALKGYVSGLADWEKELTLSFGEFDGKTFPVEWTDRQDNKINSKITPRGEVLDLSVGSSILAPWRWALGNEIILAPLDSVAQIGDSWTRRTLTALPNAQLRQTPVLRQAEGTVKFEGTELYMGKPCYIYSKTTIIEEPDILPQDLMDTAYGDYFSQKKIRLTSGGQITYSKAWIDRETLLPVKTELRTSSAFWWKNRDRPDSFISSHDALAAYENKSDVRYVVTMGRVLTAVFEVE